MKSINNPKGRHNDLVVQDSENEVLIYDLKLNKAYCLNETSALIWRLCDGTNSVAEIIQSISEELKLTVSDDIVWLALDQLKQDNLLVNGDEVEVKFNGLSRREVVRKAGAASMIALPFIASLIAPRSVDAQSTCVLRATCTCSVNNTINLTTGAPCRTLPLPGTPPAGFGTPTGCGSSLTCDCLVAVSTNEGVCVGV
jgi:hypothetical protein